MIFRRFLLYTMLVLLSSNFCQAQANAQFQFNDDSTFTIPIDKIPPEKIQRAQQKRITLKDQNEATMKAQMLGKACPTFSLFDLDSNLYSNGNLKGKVVLLNVWEIGCLPCMMEIRQLNKLKKDYEGKDFVLISMTPLSKKIMSSFKGESKESTKMDSAFSSVKKIFRIGTIDFPIIPTCNEATTPDFNTDIIKLTQFCDYLKDSFLIQSYPTTFIIDKKGIIRDIRIGFGLEDRNVDIFSSKVDELLKE